MENLGRKKNYDFTYCDFLLFIYLLYLTGYILLFRIRQKVNRNFKIQIVTVCRKFLVLI